MHRIDHATAVANMHGAGKPGFGGGNPTTGTPATRFTPDWCNDLQENIARVIEGADIALEKGDGDQLYKAIQGLIAGAATAIVLQSQTFAPGVVNGNPVRWDAANSRWALALADGTANDLVVGFADVANGAVYCFGRSRAGLFAGLTVGARYYISATGTLTTTAASDTIYAGVAVAANTLFIDLDPGPSSLSGYARLNIVQTWAKAQSSTPVTIVDGASPAIDLSAGNVFVWALGAARTLPLPSNVAAGQSGVIWLRPNTYTLSYNTFWQFGGGAIPTVSTAAGARDLLVYEVDETATHATCALIKGSA